MKKLLLATVFILPFFIYQCSQNENNPVSTSTNTKSVAVSIETKEGFDQIAKYATVVVTGKDMKPISTNLTIGKTTISGTVNNIPVGLDRFFEVTVYNDKKVAIYAGSSYADIELGEITYVNIILYKLDGGTAVINGTIEDIVDPCKEIKIGKLSFGKVEVVPEKEIVNIAFGAAAQTNNGDPVEYSWIIYGIDEMAVEYKWDKGNSIYIQAPMNAEVMVIVNARCAIHQKITVSDTLNIYIENGKVTEIPSPGNSCTSINIIYFGCGSQRPDVSKKYVIAGISAYAMTDYNHPVEYSWQIQGIDPKPAFIPWSQKENNLELILPYDGNAVVIMSARCMNHNKVMITDTLWLVIKGGVVYEEINDPQNRIITITYLNLRSIIVNQNKKHLTLELEAAATLTTKESIEYSWAVYTENGGRFESGWNAKANIFSFPFPMSGALKGQLSVRCATHLNTIKTTSFDLWIENGELANFNGEIPENKDYPLNVITE
jgi:hypothetical protein